ncbi:MAG: hypothetical protein ABL882_11750 [Sphingopyxis sp.]
MTAIRTIQDRLSFDTWIDIEAGHIRHRDVALDETLDVVQQFLFVDTHE